ncbi:MAG: hypothetical protein ACM31C_34690 [Acidobacteriota bacterium]
MTRLLLVLALVIASRAASAGDALVLVCSARVQPTDDGRAVAVSIQYLDRRAADGTSRDIALSAMHRATVFQARWRKTGDAEDKIALALVAGTHALFRGSYTLAKIGAGFSLRVIGNITADPTPKKPEYHPIDATLPCVDISP